MKNNLGDTGTGATGGNSPDGQTDSKPAKTGDTGSAAMQFKRTGGHCSAASRQAKRGLRDKDGRQQLPLNRIERCAFNTRRNRCDTSDNYGDVIPVRYTLPDSPCSFFYKTLILLLRTEVVPVVELEPTRLFIVPGF